MIKKIPLAQLQPGMYVHDLNCSWGVHPFFATRFKVKNEKEIEKAVEMGVREVYIDTTLGHDLPDAPTVGEVQAELESELILLAGGRENVVADRVSLGEEIGSAEEIHGRANQVVRGMMSDVRLGRQIEQEDMDEAVQEITESILRNSSALLHLNQIRKKDDYTFLHSVGVCALITAFCKTMQLGKDITRQVSIGAMLHDIGKMKVPSEILNKPGRLTEDEFSIMRRHVDFGRDVAERIEWLSPISLAVLTQHHERFDGSGYPHRLKGSAISQFGQMAAIVDVYDAISAERVYHQALAPVEALRKIQEWGKFHFNEELVGHFIRSIGIYPIGTLVLLESDRLGIVVEQNAGDLLRPVVRVVYDAARRWEVPPHDIDLSSPSDSADRVVTYQDPHKWGIDPNLYLSVALQ